MTPIRETALNEISNISNFSLSKHLLKKIVIIGDRLLATLVKVSETYLITHNIRAVVKTD